MSDETCPECGHPWDAHQGRPIPHHHRCLYSKYRDYRCPCRSINPKVEAEERRAAALWNMTMHPHPQETE